MIKTAEDRGGDVIPGDLASLLCCPFCRSDLKMLGETLLCTKEDCRRTFRLAGRIPVLADESTSAIAFELPADRTGRSSAKKIALRYLPGLDLNVVPKRTIARISSEILSRGDRPVVVNIGGKHPTSITDEICSRDDVIAVECDLAYRARTRVFANPAKLPLADGSADAVLLDGLLEHVPEPQDVVREAWRVLKPDGILYSDTPFMLQVHGGAFDYSRFSHQAHRWLLRDFEELESGVSSGPGVALSYAIQYFLLCFAFGQRSRYAVKTLCRLTLFWLKYLDLLIAHRPAAKDAAHGFFFLGRKTNTATGERELAGRYGGSVPNLYPSQ